MLCVLVTLRQRHWMFGVGTIREADKRASLLQLPGSQDQFRRWGDSANQSYPVIKLLNRIR